MSFSDCFKEFHEIEIDKHLRLHRHHPHQDAETFFRVCGNRDAFRFFDCYTWPGDRFTDACVKVPNSRIKGFDIKNDFTWTVDCGEPIGKIRLYDFKTKNTACTIGYFLKRECRNRGINTRCVKAVCDFALVNYKPGPC